MQPKGSNDPNYPISARFNTTEEYYAEQDMFLAYVAHKVNPARHNAGLPMIHESAARRCFDIIVNQTYRQPTD
jgi:hypothetical protein